MWGRSLSSYFLRSPAPYQPALVLHDKFGSTGHAFLTALISYLIQEGCEILFLLAQIFVSTGEASLQGYCGLNRLAVFSDGSDWPDQREARGICTLAFELAFTGSGTAECPLICLFSVISPHRQNSSPTCRPHMRDLVREMDKYRLAIHSW